MLPRCEAPLPCRKGPSLGGTDSLGRRCRILGDSDRIQLAETVYAVGNPGGTLSGSITDGIISATSRTISIAVENGANPYGFGAGSHTVSLNVLQTNAAVSPGNSGGGLFNAKGELIGIVNAKSSGENQEGLGFAIPINTAQEIAVSLINEGSYTAPNSESNGNDAVLEITIAEVDPVAAQMNRREAGIYIQSVKEGGASDGKLEVNDRIISMNDRVVRTSKELSAFLAEYKPGDTASVSVERDGKLVSVDIVLAQRKDS